MPTNEPLSKAEITIARTIRPTGLKQRSLLLMIVLAVVTFGLYYPIWFLRRRAALNGLDSPRKLQRWPFLLFLAFVALQFIVSIASGSEPLEQTIGAGASLLLDLMQLAVAVLMVVQCFLIKDILEDHLAGPEDKLSSSISSDTVKLSALMTFFFQIFYLQHVINRDIVGRDLRRGLV
jgi:uncharacterized protein DUF4234